MPTRNHGRLACEEALIANRRRPGQALDDASVLEHGQRVGADGPGALDRGRVARASRAPGAHIVPVPMRQCGQQRKKKKKRAAYPDRPRPPLC